MNNFVPNEEFFRSIALFYFHKDYTAFGCQQILSKVYSVNAPDLQICEKWDEEFTNDKSLTQKYMDTTIMGTHEMIAVPSPGVVFFRRIMLHYYNMYYNTKEYRSAASWCCIYLNEIYGSSTPSEQTCRKWFKRFRSGDFNLKDRVQRRPPKKIKDEDLKELIENDTSLSQKQLAKTFNVSQQAISQRLMLLKSIEKV